MLRRYSLPAYLGLRELGKGLQLPVVVWAAAAMLLDANLLHGPQRRGPRSVELLALLQPHDAEAAPSELTLSCPYLAGPAGASTAIEEVLSVGGRDIGVEFCVLHQRRGRRTEIGARGCHPAVS